MVYDGSMSNVTYLENARQTLELVKRARILALDELEQLRVEITEVDENDPKAKEQIADIYQRLLNARALLKGLEVKVTWISENLGGIPNGQHRSE